jgi:hypothetical protein
VNFLGNKSVDVHHDFHLNAARSRPEVFRSPAYIKILAASEEGGEGRAGDPTSGTGDGSNH